MVRCSGRDRTKFRCAVGRYVHALRLTSAEPQSLLDHSRVISTSWRVWRRSLYPWAMLSLAQAARKRGLDGGTLWGNLPLSDSNLLSPFDSKAACFSQAVILGLTGWNLALFCASVPKRWWQFKALERADVQFTNGKRPGVRMGSNSLAAKV